MIRQSWTEKLPSQNRRDYKKLMKQKFKVKVTQNHIYKNLRSRVSFLRFRKVHFYLSRFSSRYRKLERWKELHVSACANICVCLSTHDTATYISLTRMLSLFILNLSAIVVAFSLVNTFPSQDQGHAMLYNLEWKNAEIRDIEQRVWEEDLNDAFKLSYNETK